MEKIKNYALPHNTKGTTHGILEVLPPGWKKTTDPTTGDMYYYNSVTEETSWDPPPSGARDGGGGSPVAGSHFGDNDSPVPGAVGRSGGRSPGKSPGTNHNGSGHEAQSPATNGHTPSRPTMGAPQIRSSPRVARGAVSEVGGTNQSPGPADEHVEYNQRNEQGMHQLKEHRHELELAELRAAANAQAREEAEAEAAARRQLFDEEEQRVREEERIRHIQLEARKQQIEAEEQLLAREELELEAERALRDQVDARRGQGQNPDDEQKQHQAATAIQAKFRGRAERGALGSNGGGALGDIGGAPTNAMDSSFRKAAFEDDRPHLGMDVIPLDNGMNGMNSHINGVPGVMPALADHGPGDSGTGTEMPAEAQEAQDSAFNEALAYEQAVKQEMQRIQSQASAWEDQRLDNEASAQVMADVLKSVEDPKMLLENKGAGADMGPTTNNASIEVWEPSKAQEVQPSPPVKQGLVLNEGTLKLIARLVDQRLVEEFRRRDDVISEMKDAMQRLRSQMSTQAERWSAHQDQLALQHLSDLGPRDVARARIRARDGRAGGSKQPSSKSPERNRLLPVLSQSSDPSERRAANMPHGHALHNGVRQPEFDENLPRVAKLKKGMPARTGSIHQGDHQKIISKAAIRYSPCKSMVYAPSVLDYGKANEDEVFPQELTKDLDLDYVHAYSGDWGRHYDGQHRMSNVLTVKSGELVFPAATLVVILNHSTNDQRFYSGHSGKVSALAVHPDGDFVASGESGQSPMIQVLGVGSAPYSNTPAPLKCKLYRNHTQIWSAAEQAPKAMVELLISKEKKIGAVKTLDFSSDGKLLVCLTEDSHQTASVWDWRHSKCIATLRQVSSHPVFCMKFNPYLCVPETQVANPDNATYTLVSCGLRHLKFWTLTREEQKETGDRYSVAAQAAAPPEWKLEANVASTGRATDHADITCLTFVPDSKGDISIGVPPSGRILTGTSNGAVLVWIQLEDLGEDLTSYMDQGGVMPTPRIRWQAKGRLLTSVAAHDGPVYDIVFMPDDLGGVITTAGRDGVIMMWTVVAGKVTRSPCC